MSLEPTPAIDLDHVETNLDESLVTPIEPAQGRGPKTALLAMVDRSDAPTEAIASPGLDLDEGHVAAPGDDEIELTLAAAPVASQHPVAGPAVPTGGPGLGEPTEVGGIGLGLDTRVAGRRTGRTSRTVGGVADRATFGRRRAGMLVA